MDVLIGDTVVVIAFMMMITVSSTTLEASKPLLLFQPEPSAQQEDTPRFFCYFKETTTPYKITTVPQLRQATQAAWTEEIKTADLQVCVCVSI